MCSKKHSLSQKLNPYFITIDLRGLLKGVFIQRLKKVIGRWD
jgi:hypothetical protein